MKTYPSKTKYDLKYQKNNIIRVVLALNKNTDNAIIEHLNAKENKSSYIKKLIIDDMKNSDSER